METIYGVEVIKGNLFETYVEEETETHYAIRSTKRLIPKDIVDGGRQSKGYYGVHYFSTEENALDYLNYAKRLEKGLDHCWADDVIDVQRRYSDAVTQSKVTKLDIINAVKWFRDLYKLKDSDALAIARNELSLAQIRLLMIGA